MSEIIVKKEHTLDPGEFREVLIKSTLGQRRPVDDFERIKQICRNSNLIVTARKDVKLIGVARSITDFVFCTYLSDLAVDIEYQNKGIGKKLIWQTKKQTPKAKLILLSAPKATEYYPKIGMKKHNFCYVLDDLKDLI
jgi:histone acetyltransferase (RNA polymerase elongator complex component)